MQTTNASSSHFTSLPVVASQNLQSTTQTDLNVIKTVVESWDKCHQIEVLRILSRTSKNKIINQNKNGIFVNLSCLHAVVIDELQAYIRYVEETLHTLRDRENEKEICKLSLHGNSL